ncbi:lysine transporter LysE [Pseudomonas syringae]|uniref:Lysine transporter LysE n=1 Tax=Pseudomonas syringae TaxID=317 RepID=A0A1C7YWU7_PSESX|nr:LysE family translocator [Pseudomonas syringae]OCR22224.1 lysine transporter LysE [Pseudomonas syringae]
MANLGMFIGALFVVFLVPGPDMVLLLQTSSTQGRGQAIATAIGLGLARAAHVTLAAAGLATLLNTVPWAFEVVRMVGVAYLVWLGIKLARASSLAPQLSTAATDASSMAYLAAMRRGLLTNITNPKALLFCSVLLPQFVQADAGSVPSQFLLLGVVLVVIGLLFDFIYAMAGVALGYWIERHPMMQTVQRWTFAAMLIAFGARLALAGRPQ